jgi:pimeloyl-ACP methyl ester carboxylesterase
VSLRHSEAVRTVLVHGLAGSSRWWRDLERRLGGLELDPVDLPRRATLPELEDWVAERLEPGAALVGHSLGGLVAARVAARRPELVKRLALIAPAGLGESSLLGYALPLARTLAAVRPRVAAMLVHDALRASPLGLWGAARIVAGTDLRNELGQIEAPTLVLWGESDRLLPVRHGYTCITLVPNGRLEIVPGAGHVPMLERPEEVSRLLREFLAGA